MSDFNAKADVYKTEMRAPVHHGKILPAPPVHSGVVVECIRWVMAKRSDERILYYMTVLLEAGFFNKKELRYPDIEAVSQRPDFPRG